MLAHVESAGAAHEQHEQHEHEHEHEQHEHEHEQHEHEQQQHEQQEQHAIKDNEIMSMRTHEDTRRGRAGNRRCR